MKYKNILFSISIIILSSVQLFAGSRETLLSKIQSILNSIPNGTKASVLIYNPLTQDTLISKNHTEPMIPASVTKLFTTATALTVMPGNHKLSTKILSDDHVLEDGVINGNLYIKGYGNPLFRTSDLENIAYRLNVLGITKITGNIIGDDSYFDDVYTREDWIPDEKANVRLPAISALVLDRNQTSSPRKRGKRIRYYSENVKEPPIFIAQKLKQIIEKNGISVEGKALNGVSPNQLKIISESTVTLNEIISIVNKSSDNFLAEILFKIIGAESAKKQGNSYYSQQAIHNFIESNGIYKNGTSIVDGSGISRFDQVTLGAVTGLLEKMYFDLVNYDDFYNSLSIASVDGTLRGRMHQTYAENNFRGKTGTLNGVSSIAGYLTAKNGDDFIVGIMFEFNKGSWNYFRNIQDKIISAVADLDE